MTSTFLVAGLSQIFNATEKNNISYCLLAEIQEAQI